MKVGKIISAIAVSSIAPMAVLGGKGKKKTGNNGVLKTLFHAAGLGTAIGSSAVAGEPANPVHPLWHQTRNDLSALLAKPCSTAGGAAVAGCAMEDRFRKWASEAKKPYVTQQILSDDEAADGPPVRFVPTAGREGEYLDRFAAFADNVANAQMYNTKSKGSSVHGITKFMDLTEEEFMKQRGGMIVDAAAHSEFKKLPKFEKPSSSAGSGAFLPGDLQAPARAEGSKDWSQDGYTTAVKDQGQCGSCWAFSTTEQVESMAIKAGISSPEGDNYVLAPQELVSCDHNGDQGCNGGLPLNAMKWLETRALEQEDDYPYMSGITGTAGRCRMKKSEGVIEVTSFKQISSGEEEEDQLVDYLLSEGPVSVGVDANNAWQTYMGGVMTADQCEGELDHAVQAVGVDTESYNPYIKVRNSWGPDWGEDGFIRLAQGTNTCGVANMGVTADVESVDAKKKKQMSVVV